MDVLNGHNCSVYLFYTKNLVAYLSVETLHLEVKPLKMKRSEIFFTTILPPSSSPPNYKKSKLKPLCLDRQFCLDTRTSFDSIVTL